MPHVGAPSFAALSRKWHALAERRLLHYGELYTSGRWTHYYASREQFARHMIEVIKAAKIWAEIAGVRRAAADQDELKPAA